MRELRWAVFDVDGTILPRASMERILIRELIREGLIPVRSFFLFFFYALRSVCRKGGRSEFLENKRYFQDLPERQLALFSKGLVDEKVMARIPAAAVDEMRALRESGYKILLMSGAPEFLLCPLAERLGADAAAGTVLETASGRLTGIPLGGHLFGQAKTRLLERQRRELGLDFSRSVVYANDSSDADHMRMFGTAVAVTPRRGLLRTARLNGWKVVEW
jgi:HAD superfamily phosphoserine phosphatase-like hydrolase